MDLIYILIHFAALIGWILLSNTLMVLLIMRLDEDKRELTWIAGLANLVLIVVTIWLFQHCELTPGWFTDKWLMMK